VKSERLSWRGVRSQVVTPSGQNRQELFFSCHEYSTFLTSLFLIGYTRGPHALRPHLAIAAAEYGIPP